MENSRPRNITNNPPSTLKTIGGIMSENPGGRGLPLPPSADTHECSGSHAKCLLDNKLGNF